MQSTAPEDFPYYQETSVASKNETYISEDIFVPCSSNRNNRYNRCPSPPESIIMAEMMSVKTARHRVQAPVYYSANRGQDYALEDGITIGVRDQSYQSFNLSGIAAPGDMLGLQICSPTISLPQGVATASSPSPQYTFQKLPEEASRKRELRMIKN
ncbi:cAMP-responsive element modulator-like isoform X1, partial [Clarias magur]